MFKFIWVRLWCRAVSVSPAAWVSATHYVGKLTMNLLSLQCCDKQQVHALCHALTMAYEDREAGRLAGLLLSALPLRCGIRMSVC